MAKFVNHSFNVNVLLDCGCRAVVPGTSVIEHREYECPWPDKEHGSRAWVTMDPSPDGYRWDCNKRGCGRGQKFGERFQSCMVAAQSHARIHAHPVRVYADQFRGWVHVPLFLSDEIPF